MAECPKRPHDHYVPVKWRQADLAQHDLEPATEILTRDHRQSGKNETHFLLPVVGQSGTSVGPPLGWAAIRCERHHGWMLPVSMALVESSVVTLDTNQSNPRRSKYYWLGGAIEHDEGD